MKLSTGWHDFRAKLDKLYPKIRKPTQFSLEFAEAANWGGLLSVISAVAFFGTFNARASTRDPRTKRSSSMFVAHSTIAYAV
jgi:hypothetical protein